MLRQWHRTYIDPAIEQGGRGSWEPDACGEQREARGVDVEHRSDDCPSITTRWDGTSAQVSTCALESANWSDRSRHHDTEDCWAISEQATVEVTQPEQLSFDHRASIRGLEPVKQPRSRLVRERSAAKNPIGSQRSDSDRSGR